MRGILPQNAFKNCSMYLYRTDRTKLLFFFFFEMRYSKILLCTKNKDTSRSIYLLYYKDTAKKLPETKKHY